MPKILTQGEREVASHQIIMAAAEEFARVGFDQAKMETIAELAEVGKGTIYTHFVSKQALFSSMLEEVSNEHIAVLKTALEDKITLEESLIAFVHTFDHLVTTQPEGFRIFISSFYGVNRRFKAEAEVHRRALLELLKPILENAHLSGTITIEVELASLLILNTAQFLIMTAESMGYPSGYIQSREDQILKMLLSGLKKKIP